MSALPVPDDASLAGAAAAGDPAALGLIYDRYAGRLFGFCQTMLRSRADAEDCLQDVFVIAATRLGDLREPSLLRSWLFAIARHECLARIDRRKKEVLVDDVGDRPGPDEDAPGAAAVHSELALLLRDAADGLSERDRLLLELSDRQGLSGDELANAVGVPRSTAYTLLARARGTARKSLGALLVARTGREQCADLDDMLDGWDGRLSSLRRKQISRHIDGCPVCTEHRNRVATPLALLGEGRAFAAEPVGLRTRILAAAGTAAGAAQRPAGAGKWDHGWPPVDPVFSGRRRRRRLASLGVLLALLLIGGVTSAVLVPSSSGPAAQEVASYPASVRAASSVPAGPSSPVAVPSSGAAVVTVTRTVLVAPSDPRSTPKATVSTPPPSPTVYTLSVYTESSPADVTVGSALAVTCPGQRSASACTYPVPGGQVVSVHVGNPSEYFTAPASCTSLPAAANGATCTVTVTADLTVRVVDPVIQ